MDSLALAIFLSFAVNRIVEAFVRPIKDHNPGIDLWWLLYVSWVVAGGLSFVAGINLYGQLFAASPVVGQVLTALTVGGGANLLSDVFGSKA